MTNTPVSYDGVKGSLSGERVTRSVRKVKDLAGIFADEQAYSAMNPEQLAYEVEMHDACGEAEGGLFFGISHIHPGKVGREYMMTKGHFHAKRDRAEYYWGIRGVGILVLMDENRKAWTENVVPGSLHYIAGHVAHRLVNTGGDILVVGACWPSDAGHDYETIRQAGFSIRVVENQGEAVVIRTE